MTGFVAAVTVLLPFADPDLSYPLPAGADLRIAHPSRTHGPGCRAAVFSRDGTKLATVSDRTVLVREWPGGRRLMEIHFPRIYSDRAMLALSPDGQTVAACDVGSSRVVVGDLRTGEDWSLDSERSSHDRFANSHLAFASNGVLRVFGERISDRLAPTKEYEAVDFDPASPKPLGRMPLPGQPLAIAADGSAAILKVDEKLRRFDLTVQRLIGKGVQLEESHRVAATDAAATRLAAASDSGKVSIYDTHLGKQLALIPPPDILRYPKDEVELFQANVVFSPNGDEVALDRPTGNTPLRVWRRRVKDVREMPELTVPAPMPTRATMYYGPGADSITVIGGDGHVHTFDRTTGKRTDSSTQALGFAASGNGKWLAGYDGNTLVMRDAVSGRVIRRENRPGRPTSHMTLSDDGKDFLVDPKRNRVTIPGTDRWVELVEDQLRVHQPRDGGAITSLVAAVSLPPKDEHEWGEVFQLVVSADGRAYAVARKTHVDLFDSEFRHLRRIQVVPLRDEIGRQMFHDITEYATGVRLSADGRRVAVGKYVEVRSMPLGTEFFIHEVATGEQVSHIDYVYGDRTPLGFTPNGRHLWTAGDGVALRYDLKPGPMPVFDRRNLLAELRGENAALADLAAGRLESPGMLAWLGEQLPPDKQPDATRVAELVRQLADRDFKARETATVALIELGPGVALAMKEVQKVATSQEAKRRAMIVLNSVGGGASPGVLLRTRAVIAAAMLAEDGNQAARKLLETWAKGVSGSPLTDDARAALARLPK